VKQETLKHANELNAAIETIDMALTHIQRMAMPILLFSFEAHSHMQDLLLPPWQEYKREATERLEKARAQLVVELAAL
jgi:hypothetical protein